MDILLLFLLGFLFLGAMLLAIVVPAVRERQLSLSDLLMAMTLIGGILGFGVLLRNLLTNT